MRESKKICSLMDVFESNIGMPHKYYALGGRIEETREKIIKAQSGKKRKKIRKQLESICNDYEERNCIENDKYFLFRILLMLSTIL